LRTNIIVNYFVVGWWGWFVS